MENVKLDYGTLIVDCEKAEVLMCVGKTEEGTWVETIYSPRGGMIFNQEEPKTFIPMFDIKVVVDEELLTDRFSLYRELSEKSRNRYKLSIEEQILQLNELIKIYLNALDILKTEVIVGEDNIIIAGDEND